MMYRVRNLTCCQIVAFSTLQVGRKQVSRQDVERWRGKRSSVPTRQIPTTTHDASNYHLCTSARNAHEEVPDIVLL